MTKFNAQNERMRWALTMTFDIAHPSNKKNSITVDDVEKKLLSMTEYKEAKQVISRFCKFK